MELLQRELTNVFRIDVIQLLICLLYTSALLAFLSVCIIYLWDCFRLYGGKRQDPNGLRGIAVGLGVAGYLFAGFFNDSTVMTSTIFWILLGVGVGTVSYTHLDVYKRQLPCS